MGSPFSTPQVESRDRWIPVAIGGGIILVVIAAIFFFGRAKPSATGPAAEDPYSSNLQLSDLKMSQAENFVGGNVTYLEGRISNTGSKTITGITVEAVFRNTLGEVVDRQAQSLVLIDRRPDFVDVVNLAGRPLTPNMQHEFRLSFEHISADWNQGLPELRVLKVSAQ
jgi:hypothetical protein